MGHRAEDEDYAEFRRIFADPARRTAYLEGTGMAVEQHTAERLLADESRMRAYYDRVFRTAPNRPPTPSELRRARWLRHEKWLWLVVIPLLVVGAAVAVFLLEF